MAVQVKPFISDHVQEEWIDQDERVDIITIHAFGREFHAAFPYMLGDPDVIGIDHDGEIFACNCGQRPVADSGAWYMGDEPVMVGKIDLEFPGDWGNMCAYIEKNNVGVYVTEDWPEDFTPTLR